MAILPFAVVYSAEGEVLFKGNPGDIEVKNVHVEFKRLAAEAEKRQREEREAVQRRLRERGVAARVGEGQRVLDLQVLAQLARVDLAHIREARAEGLVVVARERRLAG